MTNINEALGVNGPSELEDLDEAYNDLLRVQNTNRRSNFLRKLTLARNAYTGPADLDAQIKIAQHCLNFFALYLENPVGTYNPTGIDMNVSAIAKPGVLEALVTSPDNHALLAALCVKRAYYSGLPFQNNKFNPNIQAILERWSGNKIDEASLYSVEETVNLLYGPAVWSLYGCDAEEASVYRHLWSLQLPLAKRFQVQATPHHTVITPDDLLC